jgi:hypothetical protein
MAFDQSTRNRLQRLVGDCRKLLVDEFSLQLQQTYGLDPKTGEVTPLDRLAHLSDRDRHTAQLLRETLAHYLAGQADTAEHRKQGIERMIREQAFTVLNRLAALLMMEARGLLLPAVSKGKQSQAFELYRRVAGTALGETGDTYRIFLFSLFDEFAQELPALFDRYAPQGRLFPREAALTQVLDLLNHHEVEPLWAEDETLGWIYQYFNSAEERKAMRKASQAPRNSRELAVRNQFFTPRYVVEFLVDNTLGRLWFNWTGGQTSLRDRCQYLLVKPDERPEPATRLRDPRTIKLLDPACGSMHFGLYAFDLFLEIYREAWDWEQTHGPGSLLPSPTSGRGAGGEGEPFKPLSHTYDDQEAYLRDVPRLIIEHNLYGVDIDPRAAQIASLALWLRAQRAWHEAGVKAQDRPPIGKGARPRGHRSAGREETSGSALPVISIPSMPNSSRRPCRCSRACQSLGCCCRSSRSSRISFVRCSGSMAGCFGKRMQINGSKQSSGFVPPSPLLPKRPAAATRAGCSPRMRCRACA